MNRYWSPKFNYSYTNKLCINASNRWRSSKILLKWVTAKPLGWVTMLSAKCIWGNPRKILLLLKLLNSRNINRCSQLFYPILWGKKLFNVCVIKVKQKQKEDRAWESKSKMSWWWSLWPIRMIQNWVHEQKRIKRMCYLNTNTEK